MNATTTCPRDLVLAQIAHRETDHVPYVLGMEENVARALDEHYASDGWRALLENAIVTVGGANLSVAGYEPGDSPLFTDAFGSVWRIDRRPNHLAQPALPEASLDGFQWPAMDRCFRPGWREKAEAAIAARPDRLTVAGFGFGLFERAWTLRGFNEALMDAAGDPAFYDALVEAVAVHQMEVIDCLLALPVDGILFSDDWGYQQGILLGPERWRRFIKPRLARMYEQVHAAGKYCLSHCCGSVVDIMPDLVEIGLDVLESVQPEARGMNPYALKQEYGAHITFWGGLGSQSTIPFGTPDEIRREVARLADEMGRGGGYVLGPAKALQPETPTENAAAVLEGFLAQAGVPWPA
ncbi:MAG: hypothetical protein GX649_10285 [Chloroflexi bacterium]|nr:hypothetical protein [Chloroflexota bacterium]